MCLISTNKLRNLKIKCYQTNLNIWSLRLFVFVLIWFKIKMTTLLTTSNTSVYKLKCSKRRNACNHSATLLSVFSHLLCWFGLAPYYTSSFNLWSPRHPYALQEGFTPLELEAVNQHVVWEPLISLQTPRCAVTHLLHNVIEWGLI